MKVEQSALNPEPASVTRKDEIIYRIERELDQGGQGLSANTTAHLLSYVKNSAENAQFLRFDDSSYALVNKNKQLGGFKDAFSGILFISE